MFIWNSCFFDDPVDAGNLISGSSAFSKSSLYTCRFFVHILLKPSFKDFEHYLSSMWNECNCMIVWIFFGIALLLDWNENWPFPVLWPLLSFPNFLTYWVCVCVLVALLCLTLCDSMDCSLPGSSVHGIVQASYTGVYKYSLLQRIFPTQELNLGLSHCRQILYWLSYREDILSAAL